MKDICQENLKSRGYLKVNESRYTALLVFSGSIKHLFSIDCVAVGWGPIGVLKPPFECFTLSIY